MNATPADATQAGDRPTTSPPITIRAACAGDAAGLSVLATQVFADTYAPDGIRPTVAREVLSTYSMARFEQHLADAATRILVAERAAHLLGFAQLTLGAGHALALPGEPAELLRLYVQEPAAGRGLGTRLLRAAEHEARRHGARVLWLTAWVHNRRAIAFYAARGYADHGLTWFRFEGESHENRVMAIGLDVAAGGLHPGTALDAGC